MAEKLLESDFLTVDIGSMFKRRNSEPEAKNVDISDSDNTQKTAKIDWSKELTNRLAKNKELDSDARESDYKIEQQFFNEYFISEFGEDYASILMKIGSQLRNDIKALGFKKSANPILAFLHLQYVKTELIQAGLLNSRTYPAISTAIQKNLVADTEFYRKSKYNIIYCRDLYTKTSAEIVKYLEAQKECLKVTEGKYTVKTQNENKRIFLQLLKDYNKPTSELIALIKNISDEKLEKASVTNSSAKLNSLELIAKLGNINISYDDEEDENTANSSSVINGGINIEKLVSKLDVDKPANMFAVMQYISMTTGNAEAKKALQQNKFQDIKLKDLMKATAYVSEVFSNVKLTKEKAKELVAQLLSIK